MTSAFCVSIVLLFLLGSPLGVIDASRSAFPRRKRGTGWVTRFRERTAAESLFRMECLVLRAWYTDLTWAEDTATQGCDRSADPAAGMAGRRQPPQGKKSARRLAY